MGCIRWRTCWRPSRCVSATCSSWIGTARPCIFRLDRKYGARHLKRAIEKYVVYPLANLLATEQVHFGDMLVVDWDGKTMHLSFQKEGEGAVVAAATKLARGAGAQAARATGGKIVEAPAVVVIREANAPAALPSGAPS